MDVTLCSEEHLKALIASGDVSAMTAACNIGSDVIDEDASNEAIDEAEDPHGLGRGGLRGPVG